MNNKPVAWEGAEEWEQLAWELCADECGEESCTDLIWDMGVIPEPWGDRWQKYEDEAKRMIAMVRKCTHPVKELTQNIAGVWRLSDQSIQIVFTSCRSASEFEAILRKAQEK